MLLFNDLIISFLLTIWFSLDSKLNSVIVKYFLCIFISLILASIYLKLFVFKFVFIFSKLSLMLLNSFCFVKSLHKSFMVACSSLSYNNSANISFKLYSKSFYLVLIVNDCCKIYISPDFMKFITSFILT